jgi:hypothetical protein
MHLFVVPLHLPLMQSLSSEQALFNPHAVQDPPQSVSDSPVSFLPLVHCNTLFTHFDMLYVQLVLQLTSPPVKFPNVLHEAVLNPDVPSHCSLPSFTLLPHTAPPLGCCVAAVLK